MSAYNFTAPDWIDRGNYWEHNYKQGSNEWLRERANKRVTGTRFAKAAGWSRFETAEVCAQYIRGERTREYSAQALAHMARGTQGEPIVRDWYIKQKNTTVRESGLCVLKKFPQIAASADGDVYDAAGNLIGIIEIKCPAKIYQPYLQIQGKREHKYDHRYITEDYYAQMQGNMAIKNVLWCDFINCCFAEDIIILERVYYNEEYWQELYKKLQEFIAKYLS